MSRCALTTLLQYLHINRSPLTTNFTEPTNQNLYLSATYLRIPEWFWTQKNHKKKPTMQCNTYAIFTIFTLVRPRVVTNLDSVRSCHIVNARHNWGDRQCVQLQTWSTTAVEERASPFPITIAAGPLTPEANSQSSCQHLRLCSDECNRLKMRWFKLTINSYKYNEIMIWFKKQNRLVTEWKSYNYHTNRNQLQMCLPSLEKSHEIRSKRLPTRGWDFLIISWLDIKDSSTMIILKVNKAAF
jgi:hypothetical protein